jgi:hypothetical protein
MGSPPQRLHRVLESIGSGAQHRKTPLITHNGGSNYSVRATLIKNAVEDCGHQAEDPGTVDQWYFPEEGVIAFDLNPEGDDGE